MDSFFLTAKYRASLASGLLAAFLFTGCGGKQASGPTQGARLVEGEINAPVAGADKTDVARAATIDKPPVGPVQPTRAAALDLETLPDGQPVKVSGLIATSPPIDFGASTASLTLLAPSPLAPQELQFMKLRCELASDAERDGLVEEQAVVLEGFADASGRSKRLRDCRVVSRESPPVFAPAPLDPTKVSQEGSPPEFPAGVEYDQARGRMVFEAEAINDAGAVPDAAINAVKDDQRIRDVTTFASVSTAGLKQFNTLSGLRRLVLDDQEDDQTLDFAVLASHPRLRILELSTSQFSNNHLAQLSGWKCLASLEVNAVSLFEGCDLSKVDDGGLKELSKLKSLRVLLLGAKRRGEPSQVTDAGLTALGQLPRLTSLDIWSESFDGSGLAALASCESLWALRLAKSAVTVEGLQSLEKLSSLLVLDLNETDVDSGVGGVLSRMPNLHVLALKGTKVDDRIAENLAGRPSLTLLDLSRNEQITDETLETLIANPPPKLRTLKIEKTKVSEAAVAKLTALKSLRMISYGKLSDEVRNKLQHANPDLKIY